ncbi:MAG: mechanosensitive ion channel [Clostridia bacterium]|nr:mechanosensitive ion channel [Clostridia bacterium]
MDWNKIWNTIKDFFINNGWNIVKFFAVLFIGIMLIKIVMNILKKVLFKTKVEKITLQFMLGVIKFLMYLVLVLSLLSIMGIQITGILTAFSAVLLAIGVALENNIANFANGIVIVTTQMFNKGDYIICNDVEGSIENINFLFTTIKTSDGKKVILPNSDIVNNPVTNISAYETRRVQNTFSVAYESDIELVKQIIIDVMKSNGKVYLDKPIFCRLKTMSASSLDFFAYCWVDNGDYTEVNHYVIENVYNEFKRHGISVPYDQLEVRTRTDEVVLPVIGNSLPERVEKVREEEKGFDLENADLTKIFKKKKKKKKKNSNNNNGNNNNTTNK